MLNKVFVNFKFPTLALLVRQLLPRCQCAPSASWFQVAQVTAAFKQPQHPKLIMSITKLNFDIWMIITADLPVRSLSHLMGVRDFVSLRVKY